MSAMGIFQQPFRGYSAICHVCTGTQRSITCRIRGYSGSAAGMKMLYFRNQRGLAAPTTSIPRNSPPLYSFIRAIASCRMTGPSDVSMLSFVTLSCAREKGRISNTDNRTPLKPPTTEPVKTGRWNTIATSHQIPTNRRHVFIAWRSIRPQVRPSISGVM